MLKLLETASVEGTARRSQTTAAYTTIRQKILSGRLQPGEKLKITDLAHALQVSPGAIREALNRLVPEQLVVSRDNKGCIVAPLSIDDLEDLTEFRCEIEAIGLRRSVVRGDTAWEGRVLAEAHHLSKTPNRSTIDGSRTPEWNERHQAFHTALVSACCSKRLLALHAQLYQQSERYRGLAVHLEGDRDAAEEHQQLVDAALHRDADLLVELMLRHLRSTTHLIVRAAQRSAVPQTRQNQPSAALHSDLPPDL